MKRETALIEDAIRALSPGQHITYETLSELTNMDVRHAVSFLLRIHRQLL
jgi:hypothetical protein